MPQEMTPIAASDGSASSGERTAGWLDQLTKDRVDTRARSYSGFRIRAPEETLDSPS